MEAATGADIEAVRILLVSLGSCLMFALGYLAGGQL